MYQARTDPLTGAMNRWAVLSRLREEETRAEREGTYLGIGVIDVDRFKKVNDRYGHVMGDAVLNAIAARLSTSIRPYDLLGRFGGEEFLVILPRADAAEVRLVLERIRRAVSDSPIAGRRPFHSGHTKRRRCMRARNAGRRTDPSSRPGPLPCQEERAEPGGHGRDHRVPSTRRVTSRLARPASFRSPAGCDIRGRSKAAGRSQ